MSTYYKLHYHIVFGTKERQTILNTEIRPRLWSYMAGTVSGLGGFPRKINGWIDHVHLLIDLKPSHNIADIVREVKKASTPWLRQEVGIRNFSWQDGYAVFTVGHRELDVIHRYVELQEEHHRIKPFQEELAELLAEAGVEFDPKYLP
jgi:putative transposase